MLYLRWRQLIALTDEETQRLSVAKCILVHTGIHRHISQQLESDGLQMNDETVQAVSPFKKQMEPMHIRVQP